MTPFWPLELRQCAMRQGQQGTRVGYRHAFEPERGEPIMRPRGTGSLERFALSLPPMSPAQFDVFDAWFQSDLGQGSARFIWRHPITRSVRWFKMVPGARGYDMVPWASGRVLVGFEVLVLPGTPWFADYVPAGVSRVPYFVADYGEGVYGIDGSPVPASDLPGIAGTYLVERTTTTAVTSAVETLVATDIPATAPAGTTKIIGFAI